MSETISRKRAAAGLRVFLAVLIIVIVGLVIFFLVRRANRPAVVVRPETKPLTEQKVDVKEKIWFRKDTGGKYILVVFADRQFASPDGLYHLTGPDAKPENRVRIESWTRDDQLRFSFIATEVVFDEDWTRLVFRGEVDILMDGIKIKGAAFEYDKVKNIITTTERVTFEGDRFRGECRGGRYDVGSERLLFTGGIDLVVSPWANDPFPLVFTGKEMTFERSSRTGQIRGDVNVSHGRSNGRADIVDFAQFADKDGFRMFGFQGGVVIDADERAADRAVPAKKTAPGSQAAPLKEEDLIFLQGGRQHLEAGSVTILPYPGEEWLHVISLKGGGKIEITSDDGRRTTLEAGELDFFYNRDGSLQDFNLRRSVVIRGEAEGQERLIEAPKVDFNANAGDLVATGDGERAHMRSGSRDARAVSMLINLRTNNFRMTGDVRIVSLAQAGKARDAALFDETQPVFMTAGDVFYEAALQLFRMTQKARLWQGHDSLEADRVEILEGSGDLTAIGAVRSVFFHRPKGKDKDERIEVTGNRLVREVKKGRVVYQGGCSLSAAAIILKAGRLILDPAEEAGKFKRIFADLGRVTIFQGERKAEGDQADYDLIEDLIVLAGRTVLEDKEKGTSRGGKLTFRPADGTITIEKQDAERSTTIIKS